MSNLVDKYKQSENIIDLAAALSESMLNVVINLLMMQFLC